MARETQEYFNAIKQAGELPPDSEAQLAEINATADGLATKLEQIESKINVLWSQPQIADRIHEQALKERDGELKEAEMKKTLEELLKENDTIAQELNGVAKEDRRLTEEHAKITVELKELDRTLTDVIKRAQKGLDWQKHRVALGVLGNTIPSVTQLQEARAELGGVKGVFKGTEKAAVDIVLRLSTELERYQNLSERQKKLHNKLWKDREQKKADIINRIKKHMVKACEIHEKTDIARDRWQGVDIPQKFMMI